MIKFTAQELNPQPSEGSSRGFGRLLKLFAGRIRLSPLFLALVVLPTSLAAFYYLLLAAPIYVSEARFVVRSPSSQMPTNLDSVLVGVGLGSASAGTSDAFAVHEYIMSRSAVVDLEKHHDLRDRLSRPTIDFIAKFPRPFERRTFEDLFSAYSRFVAVSYDGQTGISTLRVKAFTPKDASDIATALLDDGEVILNRLNDRSAADAVEDANRQMREAESAVASTEEALTDFRNREKLIDPSRSSLADLELVAKVEGELATLRAQRAALAMSAPLSPQLPILDQQIVAFQAQADGEKAKIAGEDTSLAPLIGEYEQLTIQRDFAAKELSVASGSEEAARLDLRKKHLYLERIVPPNTPDAPREPRRFYSILMDFLTCLLVYGAVVLIRAGFREHGQVE